MQQNRSMGRRRKCVASSFPAIFQLHLYNLCGIRKGCGRHLLRFASAVCQIWLPQTALKRTSSEAYCQQNPQPCNHSHSRLFSFCNESKVEHQKHAEPQTLCPTLFWFHFLCVISYVILLFWKWWHTATGSGSKTAARYLCSFTEIIPIISL